MTTQPSSRRAGRVLLSTSLIFAMGACSSLMPAPFSQEPLLPSSLPWAPAAA